MAGSASTSCPRRERGQRPATGWVGCHIASCTAGTLNEIARSSTGAFEPRRFWTAWDRGAATTVDVLDPGWDFWADFWAATPVPLDELRHTYPVPAIDGALLA